MSRVRVRFFGPARDATGVATTGLELDTVSELVGVLRARYGEPIVSLLPSCQIWVNGEPAQVDDKLADGDEVAVLPPVSGG